MALVLTALLVTACLARSVMRGQHHQPGSLVMKGFTAPVLPTLCCRSRALQATIVLDWVTQNQVVHVRRATSALAMQCHHHLLMELLETFVLRVTFVLKEVSMVLLALQARMDRQKGPEMN